jgi:hypothetical protein
MKYKFFLIDTRNGFEKCYEDDYDLKEWQKGPYGSDYKEQSDIEGTILFYWLEDDNSCDCNRMNKMYGYDENHQCNSDDNIIELLKIIREDGKVIYDKEKDMW